MDETQAAVLIAVIPAGVSVLSAVLAVRSATKARVAEGETARLRQLEERTAGKKYEVYEPMLRLMGDLLTPGRLESAGKEMERVLPDFMTFLSVWGSDEAVIAFTRFRTASNYDPPVEITMRIVADFQVAARKDLGDDSTRVTGLETMGMRINDLYTRPDMVEAFTMPFESLAARHSWPIPWAQGF